MISDGGLYFKVDEINRNDFKNLESKPFIHHVHKGENVTMSYWLLPEEIMENPDKLKIWVEKSVDASIKAKKK